MGDWVHPKFFAQNLGRTLHSERLTIVGDFDRVDLGCYNFHIDVRIDALAMTKAIVHFELKLELEPMRALVISDKVEPILYSGAICERVGKVDLILSCGDLPFYYIEYIISMLNKPAYYVMGNHGREFEYQSGKGDNWNHQTAPQGAVNLHGRTAKEGPLLLAGLEGSIRYNDSAEAQYTDFEMKWNIGRLARRLLYNRLRYGRWLDVLIAHSPPFGIHDKPDRPHQGFRAFLPFMRYFKPRYLLHGHIHLYRQNEVTRTQYHQTEVINVYPFRLLDLDPQVNG